MAAVTETDETTKNQVKAFWDAAPCGTRDVVPPPQPDLAYFEALDGRRYELEPEVERFAAFETRRGQRVLEVGCGAGADLARFAAAGADAAGVDLSTSSVGVGRERKSTRSNSRPG